MNNRTHSGIGGALLVKTSCVVLLFFGAPCGVSLMSLFILVVFHGACLSQSCSHSETFYPQKILGASRVQCRGTECVCVCVSECTHTHTDAHRHRHKQACTHTGTHTGTHKQAGTRAHTHAHAGTNAHRQAYSLIQARTHTLC